MEQEREIARTGRPRLATPDQEQMLIESAERIQRRTEELRRIATCVSSSRRTSQGRERHEAKADAGRLADGIPPERYWASDPAGINQVDCIYTPQGFEFDYVGVIIGRDLRWDPSSEEWIGDPSESFDSIVNRSSDHFTDLVKRAYGVLLTRGMKGCYVYIGEVTAERHVQARLVAPLRQRLAATTREVLCSSSASGYKRGSSTA